MKRRPVTRAVVVMALVAAGALFYWQLQQQPVETPLAFVLTGVEARGPSGLLRHEDISLLEVTIIDAEGQEVATIVHKRPGAVAHPAPVRLPRGTYSLRMTVRFGQQAQRSFLQSHPLEGEPVTVHL